MIIVDGRGLHEMEDGTAEAEKAEAPDLQAKMEAQMRQAVYRDNGAALGGGLAGQLHWSVANQIRHAAFSSAMDIHRHRGTSHEEIIESAKAFETYLAGE